MKRYITKIKILCLLIILISLSGCLADLFLVEEVELAAGRAALGELAAERVALGELAAERAALGEFVEGRAALGELSETRAAGSLSRASRMGITVEDINIFSRSTAEIRAGRLISVDEVAFNSELGKIKLVRSSGEYPLLYLRNASEPFAEVLPEEGKVRLFNGSKISLHNNIYSVESKFINVRYNPKISSNNIVATLHQGDLVVKLAEENGWYHVKIIQEGQEILGFIDASLLTAVVILASNEDDKDKTPEELITIETQNRWNYYWAKIGGNRVIQMTGQDAINILYDVFGANKFNRKISYNVNDWSSDVTIFLKMDYNNIPILNQKNFKAKDLEIIGFTKSGELLQYIEFRDEYVKLSDPMDWGPKDYGQWYKVKTLAGQYGWVFTKPFEQNYSTGTLVKRCYPGTIHITSNTVNAYDIYINGKFYFKMNGKVTKKITVSSGTYTIRVLQSNGYVFYPTDKSFKVNVKCGEMASLTYP